MDLTKFKQSLTKTGWFQNLSSVGMEMGKQAGWRSDELILPSVLVQQVISVPFAVVIDK